MSEILDVGLYEDRKTCEAVRVTGDNMKLLDGWVPPPWKANVESAGRPRRRGKKGPYVGLYCGAAGFVTAAEVGEWLVKTGYNGLTVFRDGEFRARFDKAGEAWHGKLQCEEMPQTGQK
jgi:hypothetical protein